MHETINEVVLTGCGWVAPFGAGTADQIFPRLLQMSEAQRTSHWQIPDELRGQLEARLPESPSDRGTWVTALALEHALKSAKLGVQAVAGERTALVLGHALAGQIGMMEFATDVRVQSARFVTPLRFPQTVGNYISGALARGYKVRGPMSTIACGAASGLAAMLEAADLIARGLADLAIAGGADVLSAPLADAFIARGRKPSEGACLFVMESRRAAETRGACMMAAVESNRALQDKGGVGLQVRAMVAGREIEGVPTIHVADWTGCTLGALGAMAASVGIACATRAGGLLSLPSLISGAEAKGLATKPGGKVEVLASGDPRFGDSDAGSVSALFSCHT